MEKGYDSCNPMKYFVSERTISIDDLRRNFGEIKKELPYVTFIVTDRGKPVAQITAPPGTKKKMMKQVFGAWKDTELDNDALWNDVFKKKSRKKSIDL